MKIVSAFRCFVLFLCLENISCAMKVVIDEKIPYLKEAMAGMGVDVVALPGATIANADLLDAQALFVRTRTVCDAALLANTAVRFIGTATIGYDHIDAGFYTHHQGSVSDEMLLYHTSRQSPPDQPARGHRHQPSAGRSPAP